MEIKFNIEKSQRKALAQKIGELTGAEVKYLGVPGCRYQIDFFTLDKNAVLSFSDRIDTDIVEKVLNGLAEAGYESKTVAPPEETDASAESEPDIPDEPSSGFPLLASISFPIAEHTVQSLTNLICMIHSRGALLSKATGGQFFADKSLADAILDDKTFRSIHELIAYIRVWEETNPELKGIRFADDKLIFDGFGAAQDAETVKTFTKLAAAMNKMAITQKRVQAKDVDDSNEKYALRIWLIRLGLNGADFKVDRKRLMAPLSGHTAFRNDEERERWEAKQKAKRDVAKEEQNEEEENNAVSE
ncbi:MAG TPA: hypothetical protein PLH83_12800 [Ruminococcus sp.]|nr:hypothetical protein [Ruminococcus sp.]